MAHAIEVAAFSVGSARELQFADWQAEAQFCLAKNFGCFGSEHRERAVMIADVENLHVVGDDVFFESGEECGSDAWFEIEEQFIVEAIDICVGNHLAFGVGDRAVTSLARLQSVDVVGDLAVEKTRSVPARDAETASKAQVSHGYTLAEVSIFIERVPIIIHHGHAVHAGGACFGNSRFSILDF